MKQEETAVILDQDIEKFKKNVVIKCQTIRDNSKKEQASQEKRLKELFTNSNDSTFGEANSSKLLMCLKAVSESLEIRYASPPS